MMDRDQLLDTLGNVHEFLKAIDDPGADAVAMAAAVIAGDVEQKPAARLLTLREVKKWKDLLWLEVAAPYTEDHQGHLYRGLYEGEDEDAVLLFKLRGRPFISRTSAINYGLSIRCWATRPSADDMAVTPWEEDI